MAEEKKKSNNLLKFGFITSTLCCVALIGDKINTEMQKKTILGTTIKLDSNAKVYSSVQDMIKNTKEKY